MGKKQNNKSNKENIMNGIAVGLSFLIVSGVLYMFPDFLTYELLSYIVGAIIGMIGILGLFVEIGRLGEEYNKAMGHILLSIFLGVILYIVYYFFSNIVINFIILLISLLILYAFLLGLFQILNTVINKNDIKNNIVKIAIFILNLLIFALTVLQILQILKIIK